MNRRVALLLSLIATCAHAQMFPGAPVQMRSGSGQSDASMALATQNFMLFGDGRDGPLACSAPTTLTRVMYYSSVTITAGCVLSMVTGNFYVSGTLDLTACPANGLFFAPNAGGNAVVTVGGAAGTGVSSGGGTGPAGPNGGTAGGTQGTAPTQNSVGNGGVSGASGAGGNAGVNNGGGSRPIVAAALAVPKGIILNGYTIQTAGGTTRGGQGAASGGSGAGDGTAGGGGGGGGAGGNNFYIAARFVSRGASTATGCINLIGAAGGKGGTPAGGARGGGAGGGGGGGGWGTLIVGQLLGSTAATAIDLSGGTGGDGGNGTSTGLGGNGGQGGGGGSFDLWNLAAGTSTHTVAGSTGGTLGNTTVTATGATGGAGEVSQVPL